MGAIVCLTAMLLAAPVPATKPGESVVAKARKALETTGDLRLENAPINDLITQVQERFKVDLQQDQFALNGIGFLDPMGTTITVNVTGVKLKEALKKALEPHGLIVGVCGEGLIITNEEGLIYKQLRATVQLEGNNRKFPVVVKELAELTGANIVFDPRLKDNFEQATVSELKLADVPLETAIRLTSEVAGFRVVRFSNVLFITSEARAESLRKDADGPLPANRDMGLRLGGFGGVARN